MWPLNLYIRDGLTGDGYPAALAYSEWIEAYVSLAPAERAIGQLVVTLVLASVVVGILQGFGTRAVTKTNRSPIISFCIGLPVVLVLATLTATGYLILGSAIGTFFGMLFILLGVTALPTGVTVGYVAIGRALASRLGRDDLSVGVAVGSLLCGVVGVSIPATVGLAILAGTLGTGATVRILFGGGGVSSPEERTVPPANKI